MATDTEKRGRHSKRNSTACEHCRAARVKCQASEQPGVCERCLVSKRECIARSRPRPSRWELTRGPGDSNPQSQSLEQSGTFSINYSVPVKADLSDNFETLREMHVQALDTMLIEETSQRARQSVRPCLPDTSDSSDQSHPVANVLRQPLFNLGSAESLLNTFRSMVQYLPFITLPEDTPVTHLAATSPFILLSILTVASGSTMVQKHALYDDEFRKALGLKYVSGGERSLELLQGLLIYCAWYPFHLRPKNGQLIHSLRIAADVVRDLHLDKDLLTVSDALDRGVTENHLDRIRAYLAYVYLVSTYVVVWEGEKSLSTDIPSWASTAMDILQHNTQVDGDNTLVVLVRMSTLFSVTSQAINKNGLQAVESSRLLLAEHQQHRNGMNHHIMGYGAIHLQALFLDIFLDCGSLLAIPVAKPYLYAKATRCPPPTYIICIATQKIRLWLDFVSQLDDTAILSFTVNEWTRLIVILTLSFRLSFPIALYPDFDSAWARSELQLDRFLSGISSRPHSTASNSVLSATRAVLGVVKSKYDRRLAALGDPPSAAPASRTFGCPVMDGGFNAHAEYCDARLSASLESLAGAGEPQHHPLFHDLWATMTMGWGSASELPWDTCEGTF